LVVDRDHPVSTSYRLVDSCWSTGHRGAPEAGAADRSVCRDRRPVVWAATCVAARLV